MKKSKTRSNKENPDSQYQKFYDALLKHHGPNHWSVREYAETAKLLGVKLVIKPKTKKSR